MRKMLTATAAALVAATGAFAESHGGETKIGIILGFTGPIESLTPDMAGAAEAALNELNASGMTGGMTFVPIRADSTCTDAAAASAAAERLLTADRVAAIMGADCSGVTTAILNNVAVPNGAVMVSPSATSPALSAVDDKDLFFRTAPSDARQGDVLANVLMERGLTEVAVTYTNNDYGKGFADAFNAAFAAAGGTVTATVPHEDGKSDYSAEVASLAAAGGSALVVLGYVDQGGRGIIRASLDTGAFDIFALGDGMYGDSLLETFGSEIDGTIGTVPGSENEGAKIAADLLSAAGLNASGPYTGESYDAAALIGLGLVKGGDLSAAIMEIANAPGEPILPGELGKAAEILAAGGDVDYVGATGVELIGPGEAAGAYREYEIRDGKFETVKFR